VGESELTKSKEIQAVRYLYIKGRVYGRYCAQTLYHYDEGKNRRAKDKGTKDKNKCVGEMMKVKQGVEQKESGLWEVM